MTVEKLTPKQLLRPITTGAGSAMNQSQFLAITCNSLAARERSRVHGTVGFGLHSHWLKNWHESFKPITKRSNRNHVITFDTNCRDPLHGLGQYLNIREYKFRYHDLAFGNKFSLTLPLIWIFCLQLSSFRLCQKATHKTSHSSKTTEPQE